MILLVRHTNKHRLSHTAHRRSYIAPISSFDRWFKQSTLLTGKRRWTVIFSDERKLPQPNANCQTCASGMVIRRGSRTSSPRQATQRFVCRAAVSQPLCWSTHPPERSPGLHCKTAPELRWVHRGIGEVEVGHTCRHWMVAVRHKAARAYPAPDHGRSHGTVGYDGGTLTPPPPFWEGDGGQWQAAQNTGDRCGGARRRCVLNFYLKSYIHL